MSLLWTIILAVIQGLTEFLPVSSSAHLTILGAVAGIKEDDALAFFLVLHMGTLLAVVAYFWRDLWGLARGALGGSKESWRYIGLLAFSSVPTGVIGLALKGPVEKAMVSPAAAAGFLLVTAAVLFCTRLLPEGEKGGERITWRDAALVGIAQGIAVFPGISRSGATISAALALGLRREEAFRYSFLVSLPAVGGAFLLEGREALAATNPHLMDDLAGLAISFIVGMSALALLKRVLIRKGYHHFAWWCLAASAGGFAVA